MKARLHPHLSFAGDCAPAFRFYAEQLGGRLYTLTWGESPMASQVGEERRGWILHATLQAGDLTLTGADLPPEQYKRPQGTWVLLHVDAADDADRLFAALAPGGEVTVPIAETFWAVRFGMLTDRFGTPWMIQVGKPD